MNIHLIKTPEYSAEEFNDVYELLNSFNGPLNFSFSGYEFDKEEFPFLQKFYQDFKFEYESDTKKVDFIKALGIPLSWRELFSLCQKYRDVNNIPNDDFVILLTVRRNALNWFSHYENKNVFVHTGDWDYYTEKNPKYPVAYQVVENVLRIMMNLDENLESEFIHTDAVGCMNDMCQNKNQVILKLRTADICDNCIQKINDEGINSRIVEQVLDIFEGVRNELIFKQRPTPQKDPVKVTINNRSNIILPDLDNLEIRLTPLIKTLYIFYLRHTEGVALADLIDYKEELLSIYRELTGRVDDDKIKKSIHNLVNAHGNSFSEKKSTINRVINQLLDEPLAKFYRIEGKPGEAFKINLPEKLIDIQTNIKY